MLNIAFRDITENFLASIFLSMQRPFETGDLIEVSGVTGYVQQLNVRTTFPRLSQDSNTLRTIVTDGEGRHGVAFVLRAGVIMQHGEP